MSIVGANPFAEPVEAIQSEPSMRSARLIASNINQGSRRDAPNLAVQQSVLDVLDRPRHSSNSTSMASASPLPAKLSSRLRLQLSKETGSTRQFLCENWSDLKNAITECWATKEPSAPFPFALTSFVMRNVRRQKNAAERLLADREKLEV